ncbi:polysaccharide pyruvyl transferase family protein [Rhodococcus sp. IEGM 1351]|uniref:polysaccharide pyruvyl transferase family protein n=1 Tax=Rhodococcus sp. IEGM 1351 TaxID=3047089 RepID=UPI0024B67FE5|nr:polysaccharide pyruvyl transferase family protein [Rhodococcus sp. IEGM 1351]MDI9940709.1 polysaccharide pyruvyl transferase family protein [Rhodococcus sp. IEGM 1351]
MNRDASKVGILTLTQSENYGTVLQAYATYQLLNRGSRRKHFSLVPTDVQSVRRRRLISLANPRNASTGLTRYRNFADMRKFIAPYTDTSDGKNWVNISNRRSALDYLNSRFDGFVTGSDEIWNLAFVGDKSIYYAPETLGRIRVSFATSANRLDISKLSSESLDILRRSLQSYRFISVRDSNTFAFVESLLEGASSIEQIVDPTIIHGLPEFVGLHQPSADSGRKRILMMVRDRAVGEGLVSRFHNSADIDSVFIRYPGTRFLSLDPASFVRAFGAYDCVVTDFFHGTCMSVLSRAPFVSFDSEPVYSKYESKICNMLMKLGLNGRYVNLSANGRVAGNSAVHDLVDNMLTEPPVWVADGAIQREREHGLAVLARVHDAISEGLAGVR